MLYHMAFILVIHHIKNKPWVATTLQSEPQNKRRGTDLRLKSLPGAKPSQPTGMRISAYGRKPLSFGEVYYRALL